MDGHVASPMKTTKNPIEKIVHCKPPTFTMNFGFMNPFRWPSSEHLVLHPRNPETSKPVSRVRNQSLWRVPADRSANLGSRTEEHRLFIVKWGPPKMSQVIQTFPRVPHVAAARPASCAAEKRGAVPRTSVCPVSRSSDGRSDRTVEVQRPISQTRPWALIWRGRTLMWRGLGSQFTRF